MAAAVFAHNGYPGRLQGTPIPEAMMSDDAVRSVRAGGLRLRLRSLRRRARPAVLVTLAMNMTVTVTLAMTVVLAMGVASCGGPRALTQAEIAGALVNAADAGLSGWVPGTPSEVAPEAGDGDLGLLLSQTTGITPSCRDALGAFTGSLGQASAFASREYTRGESSGGAARPVDLLVAIRGYAEEAAPGLPDPAGAARDCPAFELVADGQKLSGTLQATTYDVPGTAALGLDLSSGGERARLDLVRARRGANLITASITGSDAAANHDILQRVIRAQADRVAAVAG